MTYIEQARKLRPMVVKAAQSLDDKDASEAVALFDGMRYDGSLIKMGTRINWNTAENNPDNAPTLWVDIAYHDGIRIIPETITVAQAFALDELGWWNGHIYRSTIAANVYTPDQYAAGWELLT